MGYGGEALAMPIVETSYPCFVVKCDTCGNQSWPPDTSRAGAWRIAERDWQYVETNAGPKPTFLCGNCNSKRTPA